MGIRTAIALTLFAGLAFSHLWAFQQGRRIERGEWVSQLAQAADRARQAELERDLAASTAARLAREKASLEAAQTRTETASSQERIRYVTRNIEVPAGCPVSLPDSVRDELAEGVSKANAAKR